MCFSSRVRGRRGSGRGAGRAPPRRLPVRGVHAPVDRAVRPPARAGHCRMPDVAKGRVVASAGASREVVQHVQPEGAGQDFQGGVLPHHGPHEQTVQLLGLPGHEAGLQVGGTTALSVLPAVPRPGPENTARPAAFAGGTRRCTSWLRWTWTITSSSRWIPSTTSWRRSTSTLATCVSWTSSSTSTSERVSSEGKVAIQSHVEGLPGDRCAALSHPASMRAVWTGPSQGVLHPGRDPLGRRAPGDEQARRAPHRRAARRAGRPGQAGAAEGGGPGLAQHRLMTGMAQRMFVLNFRASGRRWRS